MPFSGNCHLFDLAGSNALTNTGAVYGLIKTDLPFHPDHYTCLYVGQTDDMRAAMLEDYDNPPIIGVTHFLAETIETEEQRKQRGKELSCEFDPIGNRISDVSHHGPPEVYSASSP